MFLWGGFGVFVLVLALCIDTVDLPDLPDEHVERVIRWRRRVLSLRGLVDLIDRILKP